MANIRVGLDLPEGDEIGNLLAEIYRELAEKIADSLPADAEIFVSVSRTDPDWDDFDGYMIGVVEDNQEVEIWRSYDPAKNEIKHDLFMLAKHNQKKGIAKQVMAASLQAADKVGAEKVRVEAGLDAGGYVWLRKGAFPDGGAASLLGIASRRGKQRHDLAQLASDFILKTRSFSENQMRNFVLSDEFRNYQNLFLGAKWNGDFDLGKDRVRAAMMGEKFEASKPKKPPKIPAKELTANEKIMDAYVRHQTYMLRYAGGLRNKLTDIINGTSDEVADLIIKYATKLEGRNALLSKRGRVLVTEFSKALRAVRGEVWSKVEKEMAEQLKEFAVAEAVGTAKIIEGAVPVVLSLKTPPAQHLLSIVNARPFEGRTLKEWVQRTAAADVERILRQAKAGIVDGKHPSVIARETVGTGSRSRFISPIARKARRDLEAVLLTVTNGVQQEAKQALYEANADIIERELYTATLDASTTPQCASNDGKTYKRGEGPMPPLHFRCRSTRVPYFGEPLGTRPFKSHYEKQLLREYTTGNGLDKVKSRAGLPRGHKTQFDKWAQQRKRQMIGRVPGKTTYNDWLKTQTPDFQNEVLGPTRAKMFREGGLSLDKFVARDGSLLTLDELKAKGFTVP